MPYSFRKNYKSKSGGKFTLPLLEYMWQKYLNE